MEGWIKLHRKLYEKGFSGMPDYVAIWLYILVHAQHKDQEIVLNKQVVKINRGSLITGRKKLSSVTGVSESKTYRILKYLEIEQQIEQQKFNKFTVIHTMINILFSVPIFMNFDVSFFNKHPMAW